MGPMLVSFYVFVLAGFLGFELIRKVPPTLHTHVRRQRHVGCADAGRRTRA